MNDGSMMNDGKILTPELKEDNNTVPKVKPIELARCSLTGDPEK